MIPEVKYDDDEMHYLLKHLILLMNRDIRFTILPSHRRKCACRLVYLLVVL